MFTTDESPARVVATPAATALLESLAADRGPVTVMLTDDCARILAGGAPLPSGTLQLGRLGATGEIAFVAAADARTDWWRNCAQVDITDTTRGTSGSPIVTFALTELSDSEVFAALASGPLPRY